MTIRELFMLAESLGVADTPLCIDYECSDDWYSWSGDISSVDVKVDASESGITICIKSVL